MDRREQFEYGAFMSPSITKQGEKEFLEGYPLKEEPEFYIPDTLQEDTPH